MSRARAVLILVVLGGGLFGLSLLTWVQAEAVTPLGTEPLAVSGSDATPVVPTAGLAVGLAGLALGLSGRVVRYLASAVAVLGAVIVGVSVLGILRDPTTAAEAAAGAVAGVPEIDGPAQVTHWPWLVAILAGLTVVVAAALPFISGIWAPVARKYERPGTTTRTPPTAGGRAQHDWDALSRGEDPTLGVAAGEEEPSSGDGSADTEPGDREG